MTYVTLEDICWVRHRATIQPQVFYDDIYGRDQHLPWRLHSDKLIVTWNVHWKCIYLMHPTEHLSWATPLYRAGPFLLGCLRANSELWLLPLLSITREDGNVYPYLREGYKPLTQFILHAHYKASMSHMELLWVHDHLWHKCYCHHDPAPKPSGERHFKNERLCPSMPH